MIRAIHFPDREVFQQKALAGSTHFAEADDGLATLWFFCPCGCGQKSILEVGNGFKPEDTPSWKWNGSRTDPTLEPSVNWQNHWHGYLRLGYWEAV